jgi:hypothetical protein
VAEIGGAVYPELIADLQRALGELTAPTEGDPARWTAGQPGKWTAGQHTEHVIVVMERTAADFAAAERTLHAGGLGPPPGRGPLQRLWVSLLFRGWMPRGIPTSPFAHPGDHPERAAVVARGERALAAHAEIGARLPHEGRDRLWIPNPFRPAWRYTLPEMVRVHAVHARHHAKQIAAIVAAAGAPVQ